jgi:signal transduction histidine kinase/ligand-binding sensor domain-containing protein
LVLVWLAVPLFVLSLTGAAEQLPVKTYAAAEGLPSSSVTRIRQDSRGFLWMIAGDGISRFDGYTFTNYTTDDGLPDRRINDLLETRGGVYWVATESGLARFNPTGTRRGRGSGAPAAPMFVQVPSEQNRSPVAFTALVEGDRSVIWCGSAEGLYRIDTSSDGVARLKFVDLGMKTDRAVSVLLEDRKGFLWIGTRLGALYRLAPDGGVERYSDRNGLKTGQLMTCMLEAADGGLWLGTWGGLYRLVEDPDPTRSIVAKKYTARDGLASDWIMSLHEARDGQLWAGTNAGLCRLVASREIPAPSFRAYGLGNGFCPQEVSDVTEDRDGNLWVASRCGVAKVALDGFTGYGTADGLTTLNINSIFEDRDGGLIVVEAPAAIGSAMHTLGRRIYRFDGARFTGVVPAIPPGVAYFGWGWSQAVLQDRAGEWWIPTGAGVYRFPGAKRIEDLARASPELVTSVGEDLFNAEVFRLYEDLRGDVWIATTGRFGLWRWLRGSETLRNETPNTGVPEKTDFSAFREDSAGNLWIGTSGGGGLLRYAAGRFQRFTVADGVPPGWILSLHQDHAGRLWIATQLGGLGRVDRPAAATLTVARYTTADGLSSDNVRCLTEDEQGRIYAGTGHGVDRIDPTTGAIKRYTTANGLPRGQIENAYRDRQGALWFGSGFGLSRYFAGAPSSSPPPSVLITGLRIAGVGQRVSELGETNLLRLSLASNQNNVSIDFVGLGASPGEELRYQYRLEGAEKGWSTPTTDRTVNYARLAPGEYRFSVRSQNADGRVSPVPASVAFAIAAPLWMQWWFWIAIVLAAGAAVVALYRYRVAQVLQMATMRTRIATDLHDDIGANLTRISILSDVARDQQGDRDPDSDQPLSSISRIARESVSSMSDIVWAIDPRRDSLLDLVRRMRRHAEEVFARDTVLTIEAPDADRDLKLGAAVRRDVLLVFKEAVNNAARHAHCSRVAIVFRVEGPRLFLSIADDGAGFDASTPGEGQGLTSMRRRAEALGGVLTVTSGPDRGTAVALTVPVAPSRASEETALPTSRSR